MSLIDTIKSLFGAGKKRSGEMTVGVRDGTEKAVAHISQKASDATTATRTQVENTTDKAGNEVAIAAKDLREFAEPVFTTVDEVVASMRSNSDAEQSNKAASGISRMSGQQTLKQKKGRSPWAIQFQ